MVLETVHLLTASVTINLSVFVFSVVPRIRTLVIEKKLFQSLKKLRKTCRWFESRPWQLAKLVTDQLLIWVLLVQTLAAMCVTDVIRYPFRFPDVRDDSTSFIEFILSINLGRYCFNVVQNLFLLNTLGKLRFRAEMMHNVVALLCYLLSLAYNQNYLLGLIGIVMEASTTLDEVGKYLKEREKHRTVKYKRVVLLSCAMTLGFRGIVPLVFLVIAMFHQTPFTMDYVPLTVFFLSIIFFSVINVWLVLTNIQRLMKIFCYKADEYTLRAPPREPASHRNAHRHSSLNSSGLQLSSKNNLGYLRPYENKNFSNNLDTHEKLNLNNRKEFSKETLQLHITADAFISNEKTNITTLLEEGSDVRNNHHRLSVSDSSTGSQHLYQNPLRAPLRSSDSTDSTHSGVVLLSSNDETMTYTRTHVQCSHRTNNQPEEPIQQTPLSVFPTTPENCIQTPAT